LPEFKKFRKIALIWSFSHFLLATLFIPLHKTLLLFFNIVSDVLGFPFEMLPLPSEKFWFAFSLSAFYTVSFSAFYASLSRENVFAWVPIIVSKFVSSSMLFFFFITDVRALAYILGASFEFSLLIISIYIWKKYKDINS